MPQENVTFQQLFDQALSAQQQKRSDEALKTYQQILDQSLPVLTKSQASVVYYNMANLAFDKSDFLHAYAWSRKAVALDSGNRSAQQALDVYAKKFEIPQVPHQISTSQTAQRILAQVPLDLYFVFSVVFLLVTIRSFYKNMILKRYRQIEMNAGTNFAWKPFTGFIIFIIFVVLTTVRWTLDQKTLAILVDKSSVQTAAGENKPVIFEAQSGTEVELLQVSENYAQVRYPGAFSGWVLKNNLEILSKQLF